MNQYERQILQNALTTMRDKVLRNDLNNLDIEAYMHQFGFDKLDMHDQEDEILKFLCGNIQYVQRRVRVAYRSIHAIGGNLIVESLDASDEDDESEVDYSMYCNRCSETITDNNGHEVSWASNEVSEFRFPLIYPVSGLDGVLQSQPVVDHIVKHLSQID